MAREIQLQHIEKLSTPQQTQSMNPKKFALWLLIVSITMMFGAFTSAYIVRQAEGNWLLVELPQVFWWSTGVILLSSLGMHAAYLMAKRDNLTGMRLALIGTAILGTIFLIMQYQGWRALEAQQVFFVGNPAGSFIYVLSGVHGFHIVSGVIFLFVTLVEAFRYRVHSKQMNTLDMCVTYWHFLDVLWVYLFVFLLMNR